MQLPWIEGPRVPRVSLPRVWAPRLGHPIDCVVLAPIKRLAVHWIGDRHALHFPGACHSCTINPEWVEHGYAAAVCRCVSGGSGRPVSFSPAVVQLTEGPLNRIVYKASAANIWRLKRVCKTNGLVEVERGASASDLMHSFRPFDVDPVLSRLYGTRWLDAAGRLVGAAVDPRGKGGAK